MENVLTKAIKYSNPGSTIRVFANPQEVFLHIEVADEGNRMKPEQVERIFETFYRADPTIPYAAGWGWA